ncbi:unnamed protein product [Allacma fusca]|uniref:PHD-type domain-containing protein n=1 Tax=Allacma fusca TaxID=39272 RepID=A0A8J2K087_9HEXA|nr:unnamed protein product [Allacma fusca]
MPQWCIRIKTERRQSSVSTKRSSLIEYMIRKLSLTKRATKYWYVEDPVENFVGRTEFLEELHECVMRPAEKDVRGNRITIITGVSGVGKSEVAKKYAALYGPNSFDENVIWIKADSFETITNSFMAVSKILKIPLVEHQHPLEVHEKVYDFFSFQSAHSLFIFDNVENFKYIAGAKENGVDYFMPTNPREHRQYYPHFLIISSHNMRDTVGVKNLRILTLDQFFEQESLSVMRKILNILDPKKQLMLQSSIEAQKLHSNLYGYPLAIVLATSYIRSQERFSRILNSQYPKAFLEGFETFNNILRVETSDLSLPEPSPSDNLNKIWTTVLSQIEQNPLGSYCYEVLQIMSLLDPDSITTGLVFVIKQNIKSTIDSTQMSSPEFLKLEKVIQILSDYSLITFPAEKTCMEKYADDCRQFLWKADTAIVHFTVSSIETVLKHKPIRIHALVQRLVRQTFSNVVPRVLPSITESLLEVPKRLELWLGRSIFTIHSILAQLPDTVSSLQALETLGWKFRKHLDTTKILQDVYEIAKKIKKVITDDDLFYAWLLSLYSRVTSFAATNERTRINIPSTIFNLQQSVTVAELIKFVMKYLKIFLQSPDNWRMISVTFSFLTLLMGNWQFDRISLGLLVHMTLMAMECLNFSDPNKFEDDNPIFYFFQRVSEVFLLPTTMRLQMLKGILNFMRARPVTSTFQPNLWIILKNISKGETVIRNFYDRGGLDVFFQYWKQPKADIVVNWNDIWASFDTLLTLLSLDEPPLMAKILDAVDTSQQPSFLTRMRKIPHLQNNALIHLACSLVFMYLVKNRPDKETMYSYLLFEDLRFVLSKEFVNSMMTSFKNYYHQRFILPEGADIPKVCFNRIQKMVLKMQTSFTKAYNSGGLDVKEYISIRQELDDIYHESKSYKGFGNPERAPVKAYLLLLCLSGGNAHNFYSSCVTKDKNIRIIMEPSDSPDSTVNTDRPKVPPLILIGDRNSACSSASVKNHSLISRVSYNSATNSYSHVPTGNSEPSPKMIIIPNKLDRNLSYMIKEVDSSGASSSSSSNKTTYGSQSRPSLPVRNFLRPSLISKFEKQRRVYSSPGIGSTTKDTENPNQSIKLHIRRNPDHETAQLIVESPDSSIDSNDSSAFDSSRTSKNDASSSSLSNTVTNNSYVSSADEGPQTPSIHSVKENCKASSNSVIRQLHPEFLKQVEKQAHDKVVEIAIDDHIKSQENHSLVQDDQLDEDSGEYMDTEEPDDQDKVSNSESSKGNSDSKARDNMITIEIGDNGVISESGTIETPPEDSRRTKRKRKPTKQFAPELVIPRLKIRRKNDSEVEGSSGPSFSFETVDDKEPTVDSTSTVDIKCEAVEEESDNKCEVVSPTKKPGRGRPKGSGNKAKLAIVPPKPTGTGRGRGRPRGSRNKSKAEPRKRKSSPVVLSPPTDTAVVSTTTDEEKKVEDVIEVDIPLVPVEFLIQDVKQEISEVSSSPTRRGRGAPKGPRMRGGGRGGTRRAVQPRKPREKKEKKVKKEKKNEEKQPKTVTPVQVFEEETRMSADIKPPVAITSSPVSAPTPAPIDEESVGASNVSSTSTSVTGTTKIKKFTKDLVPDRKPVTAETLYEYCWPQSGPTVGESFMLQEQVCEYLGVKSFKRKYPDLKRRIVDMEERDFLRSLKIVSETQCDLGLTALCSSDVLDIMFNDFPEKYEEFNKVLQERKEKELVKLKGATPPTSTPPVRDRTAEFYRRCLKSTAKWNGILNRQRREERQCSFDLQTFTLHYQKGRMKVLPPEATKIGHYPVTVLPGQYCDYFKPYTPDELKYLPLNTVMYGPVRPRLPVDAAEWQSEDEAVSSSSDYSSSSDSSSSSDDESSNEIELGTKSMGDKENDVSSQSVVRLCKTCEGDHTKNKDGNPENLLHCTKCDVPNHPSCLELRVDMLPFIKKYNWQCTECKNCIECNDPADEDKMLFCDLCDRGYHIYCVGLRKVPTGRWHCRVCSVCFSCGCTQPSPDDRLAEWHHEFRKGEKNTRHFTHSLCVSCHKLYKKGQYCPSCLKVHLKLDDSKSLAECRSCEKWVHKECIKRPLQSMFGFMCDPCDAAFRSKTKLPPLVN